MRVQESYKINGIKVKIGSILGLPGSQHYREISGAPLKDPNTVWVASMGGLYSDNEGKGNLIKLLHGGRKLEKNSL